MEWSIYLNPLLLLPSRRPESKLKAQLPLPLWAETRMPWWFLWRWQIRVSFLSILHSLKQWPWCLCLWSFHPSFSPCPCLYSCSPSHQWSRHRVLRKSNSILNLKIKANACIAFTCYPMNLLNPHEQSVTFSLSLFLIFLLNIVDIQLFFDFFKLKCS